MTYIQARTQFNLDIFYFVTWMYKIVMYKNGLINSYKSILRNELIFKKKVVVMTMKHTFKER